MFSPDLSQYAQKKFDCRLPFFGMVKEDILRGLAGCGKDEQVLMKFLYGTMPLSDAGEYPFSLFFSFVTHSLMVYREMEWCRDIPEDMFLHYVLYYRINSESIEDCRRLFYEQLIDRIRGLSPKEAALEINYWCAENGTYESTDNRTMSPLTFYRCGRGRCGEESTFAVTAFRSVGIPARQVYTPWWAHCDDNHAWVEVFIDGKWRFLGACEPEEILNKGWFTNASSRALFVHARTFSDYSCSDKEDTALYLQEEFLGKEGLTACYNRTFGYARTKRLEILVTDARQNPVKQARVQILILNMAMYCEAAVLYTDEQGKTGITLGLGDIRIAGKKDNLLGQITCSVKERDSVRLVLKERREKSLREGNLQEENRQKENLREENLLKENLLKENLNPFGDPLEIWMDTDMEAPKDAPIHPSSLTAEQKAKNRARLTRCRQLRETRIKEYYREDLAARYPKEQELLQESGGNFEEIYGFLSKDENPDRKRLLHSLSVKDLKDAKLKILESHLSNSAPFRKTWEEKGRLELYVNYILCPRIYLEPLSDYKTFIREYFRVEESEKFRDNPAAVWDYIQAHIRYNPELDYETVCSSPAGCLRLSQGNLLSRKILFVAVCRTLGIPSRLNPVDLEAEFWAEESFPSTLSSSPKFFHTITSALPAAMTVTSDKRLPTEKNPEEDGKSPQGTVILLSAPEGELPCKLHRELHDELHYHQTWTIGRFQDGDIITLDYDNAVFRNNRLTLSLPAGIYRIITANRLPNGNQQASEYWFTLEEGESKTIRMWLRTGKPEEMLTENMLEDFEVTENGRKVSFSSLSENSANLLAFLAEGQEPVEHVLNELYQQAERLSRLPIRIFFILPEPEALNNRTIRKVLEKIPKIRVLFGSFEEITEPLARRMYVEPDKLPLLILTNPGMNGIYGCSGYRVGSVDLMIRLLGISLSSQ